MFLQSCNPYAALLHRHPKVKRTGYFKKNKQINSCSKQNHLNIEVLKHPALQVAGLAAERQERRQVSLAGSRVLTVCVDTAATIVDLHMVTRAELQPRQLPKSLLRRLRKIKPNAVCVCERERGLQP